MGCPSHRRKPGIQDMKEEEGEAVSLLRLRTKIFEARPGLKRLVDDEGK